MPHTSELNSKYQVAQHARLGKGDGFGFGRADDYEQKVLYDTTPDEIADHVKDGWEVEKEWTSYEPSTLISYGGDGHKYEYDVIGLYSDGTPRTQSFNARHQDDCPCHNPDEWY